MKQLIETIEKLRLRNIGFRSLKEAIDPRLPRKASSSSTCSACLRSLSAPSFGSAQSAEARGPRSARGAQEAAFPLPKFYSKMERMVLGADSDEAARLKRDDCAQGFLDDAAPL